MNNDFNSLVISTIESHNMIQSGATVIVACSGGADSMALLHFLHTQRQTLCINVMAVHVNHNLRGENSDNDERFVRNYCEKEGIRLFVKHLNFDKAPGENECRIKRYEFFDEVSMQNGGAIVATAHTKNDNAETVMLHIARGCGLFGLCGILPIRGNIIRPLLNITRAQIEDYLRQNNLNYTQDHTNFETDYARNKVRINILPQLETINSGVSTSLLRLAKTAEETNDYMRLQAQELLYKAAIENSAGEKGYDSELLASAHTAVLKTALHTIITPFADATQKNIELAVCAVKNGSGSVELSKNATFTAAQHFVRVINNSALSHNNSYYLHNEAHKSITFEMLLNKKRIQWQQDFFIAFQIINYEKTVNFEKIQKKDLKNLADYGKIKCNSIFRVKNQGDMFRKAFSNVNKPLKKVYSEAKLSAHLRESNLVLANGSEIIWAAGFGFAHDYLPAPGTQQCIKLFLQT